jgi:hypothetical protein
VELHERAQFDFLVNTAAERFVERLVQRTGSLDAALRALRADPQGEGVWLDEFVRAVLRDFLLDNTAGSLFVLGNCERRRLTGMVEGTVEQVLADLAVRAFAEVLSVKVDQGIELALSGHLGGA